MSGCRAGLVRPDNCEFIANSVGILLLATLLGA